MSTQSTAAAKSELRPEERAILDKMSVSYALKAKLVYARPNRIKFLVAREDIREIARVVRDELHFDHCTNVTGTDFPKEKQIEITYHFGSLGGGESLRHIILAISCRIPSNDSKMPSIIEECPSVELHERETSEMIGTVFVGHPNLSRLFLPEDWHDIPPLLKAYRLPGRLEGE